MNEPIRHLRPIEVEVMVSVKPLDTTLRRFRIYPEAHPEEALEVEAFGFIDASMRAEEIWPEGDPWGCDEVCDG